MASVPSRILIKFIRHVVYHGNISIHNPALVISSIIGEMSKLAL